MLKIKTRIVAMAIAALALPAVAGSWPNLPARKAAANTVQPGVAKPLVAVPPQSAAQRTVNGFEDLGGDSGWQLAPHRLVWAAGRLAHSDECDHVIRTAKAATPDELESARKLSPGA